MQARQKGFVGSERALTPEQQRIKALEKETAQLREVNEIIKKANVYFVNHWPYGILCTCDARRFGTSHGGILPIWLWWLTNGWLSCKLI
jgi:hypothetical protein